MTLKSICNREVLIAQQNDTVAEAAKLMRDYHVGNIVVIGERNRLRYPVGIVADRVIVVELVAKEVDVNSASLGDVMCREITVAKANDDVNDTINLMRQKGICRVPVVDPDGALVGIVTMDCLIDLIAEQFKDIAELIAKQQKKKYR